MRVFLIHFMDAGKIAQMRAGQAYDTKAGQHATAMSCVWVKPRHDIEGGQHTTATSCMRAKPRYDIGAENTLPLHHCCIF